MTTAMKKLVEAGNNLIEQWDNWRGLPHDHLSKLRCALAAVEAEEQAYKAAGITRLEKLAELFGAIDKSNEDAKECRGSSMEVMTATKANHLTLIWKAADACRTKEGE